MSGLHFPNKMHEYKNAFNLRTYYRSSLVDQRVKAMVLSLQQGLGCCRGMSSILGLGNLTCCGTAKKKKKKKKNLLQKKFQNQSKKQQVDH